MSLMGAYREAAHLVGSLGRRLLLALVLAVLLRRVEVKPGQGEVREGRGGQVMERRVRRLSRAADLLIGPFLLPWSILL